MRDSSEPRLSWRARKLLRLMLSRVIAGATGSGAVGASTLGTLLRAVSGTWPVISRVTMVLI
jgi:hypothetical protein